MSKQHFIPKENGSLANEVKTLTIPIAKQSDTATSSQKGLQSNFFTGLKKTNPSTELLNLF